MKKVNFALAAAILATCAAGWAQDKKVAPKPMEKVAFLGVVADPVNPDAAKQLALPRGFGLMVQVVAPDSPAKAAGIEKGDILAKLDDQSLVNPPQLAALVRSHKAGDEIKLTILRNGKETVVTAKLAEKELPAMEPRDQMFILKGGKLQFGNPGAPGTITVVPGQPEDLPNMPDIGEFHGQGNIQVGPGLPGMGGGTITVTPEPGRDGYSGPHGPNAPGRGYSGPKPFHFRVPGQPGKMEKVTYLGLATNHLPPPLSSQLSLPKGVGLIVEAVAPESPAKAAGFEQHDVLTKFNDQSLIEPGQLMVLVRNSKPGDEVKLTVIHKGKEGVVTAKLAEKEMAEPNVVFGAGEILNAPRQGFNIEVPPMPQGMGMHHGNVFFSGLSTIADDDHRLTLSKKDGQDYLLAQDNQGKTLFEGPIATEEQRAKVPPAILKKVDALREMREKGHLSDEMIRMLIRGHGRPQMAPGAGAPQAPPCPPSGPGKQSFSTSASVSMSTSENGKQFTLAQNNGDKHLTAKDEKGKVLFDGPINTPEERAKVPADLLKKVEEMEKSVHIEIHGDMLPPSPPGAAPKSPTGAPAIPPDPSRDRI